MAIRLKFGGWLFLQHCGSALVRSSAYIIKCDVRRHRDVFIG